MRFNMKFIKVPLADLKEMKRQRLDNCVLSNDAHYDTIVAYIHPNPLVRWIFWKRLKEMLNLSDKANRFLYFGSGSGVFLYRDSIRGLLPFLIRHSPRRLIG